MFGNLIGTGKNDGGGSSTNKLYCITVNNKYTFYSSTPINDGNDLHDYLQIKGTVKVFGIAGSVTTSKFEVDGITSLSYNSSTSFDIKGIKITGNFTSGSYKGGSSTTYLSGTTYSSVTISCYEV